MNGHIARTNEANVLVLTPPLAIACRREGLGEIGLYVTPPRQEIDLDKTFKEEGLVPTGKVFVYFKGGGGGGGGI